MNFGEDRDFLSSFALDSSEDSDDSYDSAPSSPTMTSNQVTIKTSVELPVYSGHPVNTKYTGKDGTCTELSRVQDWLFEIHKIGKAGGWTPQIMATQAAMKLVPGSPAGNWMKVVEQSKDDDKIKEVSTWDSFAKAMIREFGAPADFGSLVALLHSFRQEQNELVRDFYNRLVLGYNEFTLSLPDTFTGKPWEDEDDDQVQRREEVTAVVTDFHLRAFFVSGLKPEIRKEVIKAGPTDIDTILTMAKRLEQARLQEKKASPPAGSTITAAALNSAVNARLAELGFGPGNAVASAAASTKPKDGGKRRERNGEVICFYCGGAHLASKCEQRANDRSRGVWRSTIRCPETSKAQWDNMSKDERQKGAKMFAKAPNAPAAQGQQQAQQQQAGGVANVIPGLSYSNAVGGPLEAAYAAYRQGRQGN